MEIETAGELEHIGKATKGMVRCLRCGRIFGPIEIVPYEKYKEHGMKAFDAEERN
jgi:hypothetical protein